jgi:threonine dehydratase
MVIAKTKTQKPLSLDDYLKRILNARVYDVAVDTQLHEARQLSRRLHNKVLLKREDEQSVFSFKLRGA